MATESRTAKSIKNSIVALIMYFINLILQFYSRKIFLNYLGTEILGLNTTATNILQFLNLAELGISSAVAFSLYKPLHENDEETINEIISLQGHIYRRIALMIIGGATVVMCFFPWIFGKMELPLWYAYMSFGVLLLSSLLGYFVNFRQVVLSASQQEYKILYSFKSIMLVKVLCQMYAVWKFQNGYIWWAVLEGIFAIAGAYSLHFMTMKNFPYLKNATLSFKELRNKYCEIEVKIKQLFFHKIGGFALSQTSPLIIYAYASLTLVAYYGNYMIIILGLQVLMSSLFNSIGAGIGNLIVENNLNRNYLVFKELFSIRFCLISTLCFCAFTMSPKLISLWIGPKYLLPDMTLALMIAAMFLNLVRGTTDSFINGFGLFDDIWAPIVEAGLNIGLSIILGYFYGLNGILLGVVISSFIVIGCWKPYFLFTRKMKGFLFKYIYLFLIHIFLGVITWFIADYLFDHYFNFNGKQLNVQTFIFQGLESVLIYGILITILLYSFNCGLREFLTRILHYVRK